MFTQLECTWATTPLARSLTPPTIRLRTSLADSYRAPDTATLFRTSTATGGTPGRRGLLSTGTSSVASLCIPPASTATARCTSIPDSGIFRVGCRPRLTRRATTCSQDGCSCHTTRQLLLLHHVTVFPLAM